MAEERTVERCRDCPAHVLDICDEGSSLCRLSNKEWWDYPYEEIPQCCPLIEGYILIKLGDAAVIVKQY